MPPNEIVRILKGKNAAKLFESVYEVYRDIRIFGFTDEEQDMLLFQYGVFDWGQGERFELDLTRQFIRPVVYLNLNRQFLLSHQVS